MRRTLWAPALVAGLWAGAVRAQEPAEPSPGTEPAETAAAETVVEVRGLEVDWGFEAKAHFRDSEHFRQRNPFDFPPEFLPPGQEFGFLETVNEGTHIEVSTLTLFLDAAWGENLAAHGKLDFIDLYDRNPTSSDRQFDVDELWIRFGSDPGSVPEGFGLSAKVGKFPHFERQNDRHLESYGLVSTAFNRMEDMGLELAADLGRHVYLRGSVTQGNPLFLRDVNALAGDNGNPDNDPRVHPFPDPELKNGFPILYDAEVEDLDVDGDLELGGGVGFRFGEEDGGAAVDVLVWAYRRQLAETVDLHGTFYGGDLDLLDGPFPPFGLPISGDDKEEVGANLRFGWGGLSLFGQYVDQEVAGMDRTGYEIEAAWAFELPLAWAVGGRQLFPAIQPALRYSFLDPDFDGPSPKFPAPSMRWEWVKVDYGVRLTIVQGVDLTAEFADNTMTLANGNEISADELLVTLRWRI